MKRMSEVFDLPVTVFSGDTIEDSKGGYIGDFWTDDMAKAASHAINHVDALADALYECFEEMGLEGKHDSRVYRLADAALKAYRGKE